MGEEYDGKKRNRIEIVTEINRIQFKCAVVGTSENSILERCFVYCSASLLNRRENFQLKCDIFEISEKRHSYDLTSKCLIEIHALGNCLMIYFISAIWKCKGLENSTLAWEYMWNSIPKNYSCSAVKWVRCHMWAPHFTERCSLISSIRFRS